MTDNDEIAERLGRALGDGYVVERLLGSGGFASVFLVRDLALKRPLAVKVLSPDMIASRSVLERFRREAETVAQLSHPNIVPLHFIGQQDELLYLAMQCVDGGSIADRIERETKLPVDDAIRVTREIASALAHAHKRGVVHRDIKPANVLVDAESGRCLVTDFGIARTIDGASLTATGMTLGTPAYLSPEQVTGETNDHRVDIFALGVMAYQMLTGKLPFDGPTPTAAMMRRLAGPPEPLTAIRPDVPADVAEAVERCLAADPAQRWQSAGDLAAALGGSGVTPGGRTAARAVVRPSAASAGSVKRTIGIAAGVIAVVGGGYLVIQSLRSPTSAVAPDYGMVVVPGGDYVIGSDSGSPSVRPRHSARIEAFAIERTEVTVGAYRAYVDATKARSPWGAATPDSTLPVTRVSWGDAANYCAWRYPPAGRLPTEFEWEAAARGTAGLAFPWGDDRGTANANTQSARRTGPVPVANFPRGATANGLQDMSGNVWEWTASPFVAYPGASAFPDSLAEYRVIRGGAFDTPDAIATGWFRGYGKPTTSPDQLQNTGFRCAKS